jgi:hypothetical protein
LLSPSTLKSKKQTNSFNSKEKQPNKDDNTSSSKQLFSPAHINGNMKTPSYRLRVDRPSVGPDSSILSTSKIPRISIASNQKQNKRKMIEKVKVVKQDFSMPQQSFGKRLQNKLTSRAAYKKDEVEETIENSDEPKSGVNPQLQVSSQKTSAVKERQITQINDEEDDSDIDCDAPDEQHPYQLDQVMQQKIPGSHKKSKSIFSSENLVLTSQKASESPEKIPSECKQLNPGQTASSIPNLDPSGEYRIDFQRMHQQHQLKVSSHGGDIDKEPWTPRSVNLDSSGKASMNKSKSNKQKSGSDKKGPLSSKEGSLQGSSGRQNHRQTKQKALYQKLQNKADQNQSKS